PAQSVRRRVVAKVTTAAERCDLLHLATRQTAHPGSRSLLRSFPVVEQDARPPTVGALGHAGLGGCARRLFRRALQCGADPLSIVGIVGHVVSRTGPFIALARELTQPVAVPL